jgi:hypothetical protein
MIKPRKRGTTKLNHIYCSAQPLGSSYVIYKKEAFFGTFIKLLDLPYQIY